MKASDRARLTTALRDHVAKIAADLRGKMRAPGTVRVAALQLHQDERVGEDFEVWTDLLSRRAAVLWVLKSVYVRVLEDRGLLQPGRLLDSEAQQLFEKLAPNLGETAFLGWIYKDLASTKGGLPELFSPQPAEVALPSDELSRALISFWRHRDADTGVAWSFAEERFEGELMGDLYQELDPVVKDRFALCQTPDFVRAFILDRTLTPAIETFGADKVRMIDPACGSGHFLIDGLKRLVAATAEKHVDWDRKKVVAHALERVVGIDLNDYACALARTRLIMTAAELAGVTQLSDAARFHPHVYWADGLEQVEREDLKPSLQYALFEKVEDKPRATLTRSDVRVALRRVFEGKFQVVVANPPYILEADNARKLYHRELVNGRRRYVSAAGKYSLAAPFSERAFQVAAPDGFVGLIISNNFMKRTFGRLFVKQVLARVDLTLVADTSRAFIPFHGTPTVLLFAQNRSPTAPRVRVVMGKRGESGIPSDPAAAPVWTSIAEGANSPSFENEFVSVAEVDRRTLDEHPWSLGGNQAVDLKSFIESRCRETLKDVTSAIGIMAVTLQDDVYMPGEAVLVRRHVPNQHICGVVLGDQLRDWCPSDPVGSLFPYDRRTLEPALSPEGIRYLWQWRILLRKNLLFGKTKEQRGLKWFEYGMYMTNKGKTPLTIAFSALGTHNHFCLERGGSVFNRSAPVVKLIDSASESDYLALLGLLNSSTACFWMKQVFHPKGATSANRNHPDPERFAYEFASTGLEKMPVPDWGALRCEAVRITQQLDRLAQERALALSRSSWEKHIDSTEDLEAALAARWRQADDIRQQMIFWQEELDWLVYHLYGLTERWLRSDANSGRIPREQRPFVRCTGRRSFVRERGESLRPEDAEVETGSTRLAPELESISRVRELEISSNPQVAFIEVYMYKRLWRDTEDNVRESEFRRRLDSKQLHEWLVERVENAAKVRPAAVTVGRIATDLMDDRRVNVVARVLNETESYSLDAIVEEIVTNDTVPSHPAHTYTESGLVKRSVWEDIWGRQRREDAGERVSEFPDAPEYSQGSRGKSTDFVRAEYWRLRGKLDVPKERFIAFTEVPGRSGAETLYGWAGWTAQQRVKAILAIDEDLEDASVSLADRIGLLDSAWRLLPDVAREDAAAATRLKAELQALVGPEGPSRQLVEDWKKRFPPHTTRAARARKAAIIRDEEDSDIEEDGE